MLISNNGRPRNKRNILSLNMLVKNVVLYIDHFKRNIRKNDLYYTDTLLKLLVIVKGSDVNESH